MNNFVRSITTEGRKAIGCPTPNHAKIAITMERDIFDALNRIAQKEGISFGHAARAAIRKGLGMQKRFIQKETAE